MTTLEQEIRMIIEETTNCKYIGKLRVSSEILEGNTDPLWSLLLYLEMYNTPMVLAYEGSEEQFKNFVRSEIKSRKLENVSFWTAIQEQNKCDE